MKKLITTLWILILVPYVTYIQTMEKKPNTFPYSDSQVKRKRKKSMTLPTRQSNRAKPLIEIPLKNNVPYGASYYYAQDDKHITALEAAIKNFMRLSITCKKYNQCFTFRTIGILCENYPYHDKNKTLETLMKTTHSANYEIKRLPILILICAGADPNLTIGGTSLLYRAIIQEDEQLLTTLFRYKANANEASEVCPTFFYAETIGITQIFINNNVDIHTTESIHKTNVLWDILDNEYPLEIIKLYLHHKVNAKLIRPCDNACLLHEFAWPSFSCDIHNVDDFLQKAALVLNTIPDMINTLNKDGNTPIDLAYKSQKERKPAQAFEQLIILFKQHDGKTAQELKEINNLNQV